MQRFARHGLVQTYNGTTVSLKKPVMGETLQELRRVYWYAQSSKEGTVY